MYYFFRLLLASTMLLSTLASYAQPVKDILSKAIPPSPQAAALAKAVEFPVNLFSGTPTIHVPLYTITEGPVAVPISLSYSSTGLKVEEEASWTGLGWTLNAGGAIIRAVKGKDDIYGFADRSLQGVLLGSVGATTYQPDQKNINKWTCTMSTTSGNQDYSDFFYMNHGQVDGEPDLYIYNFNGYSGKFLFMQGQSIDLTNNDIQFRIVGATFEATTPDGIVYVFGELEHTQTATYGQNMNAVPYTFYLSRIQDPYDATNNMIFSYVTFEQLLNDNYPLFHDMNSTKDRYVPQMPKLNEHYAEQEGPGSLSNQLGHIKSNTNVYIEPKYLDAITFKGGLVKFDKSPRSDLYGYKLDAIKVYSTTPGQPNSFVKQYSFDYSYFTSSMIGGDHMTVQPTVTSIEKETYHVDYRSKRLKLNNVIETGGNVSGSKYQFTYEESLPMPYKSSFAQDYWGYYNGSNPLNGNTLIPDLRRYLYYATLPEALDNWHGANREPSETHMMQGILKTFTHPTKGTTTFEYEINRYTNTADVQAGVVKQRLGNRIILIDYNRNGPATPYQEFVVPAGDYNALVDVNVILNCNTMQSCVNGDISWSCGNGSDGTGNTMWTDIRKWNGSQWISVTGNQWDISKPEIRRCSANGEPGQHQYSTYLSPGTYRAYVSYPDQIAYTGGDGAAGSSSMTLDVYARVAQVNSDNTGGGLRLKRMTHDPLVGSSVITDYEYENGVMFKFPMFYWRELKMWTWSDSNTIPTWFESEYILEAGFLHYLYPTTIVPYSYSNGSLVGYKKVTEKISGNGKKVHSYHAESSRLNFDLVDWPDLWKLEFHQYLSGIESTPDLKNGSLLMEEVYREGEIVPVKRTTNTYSVVNPGVKWGFKFQNFFLDDDMTEGASNYCQGFISCFYPIHSGKVVKLQAIEENNIEGSFAQTTNTRFSYDSKKHSQLTRTIRPTSDGRDITTLTLYSKDYDGENVNAPFIDDLKSRNIIVPIETVTYQDRLGSSISILGGQVNLYKGGTLSGLPERSYTLEVDAPIALSNFRFTASGTKGFIPLAQVPAQGYSGMDDAYADTRDYFFTYSTTGDLTEYELKDGSVGSFIPGVHSSRPLASVKNARNTEICYTSFENGTTTEGNWSITSTVRPSQPFTGAKGYDLDNGSVSSSVPAKTYLLSYWKQDGSGTVTISGGGTPVLKSTSSKLGWTNEVWEVTKGAGNFSLTGTAIIDDARLHPVNAKMSTYTYAPLIGVSSLTDPNNSTTYYQYDNYGRLLFIQDNDQNIMKRFEYFYQVR